MFAATTMRIQIRSDPLRTVNPTELRVQAHPDIAEVVVRPYYSRSPGGYRNFGTQPADVLTAFAEISRQSIGDRHQRPYCHGGTGERVTANREGAHRRGAPRAGVDH